ncbi:MAG: hypothetical protein N2202_09030 [Proteobacteria bacterium]|nr:hypothetical protein [Pseudomonadota bacterium]
MKIKFINILLLCFMALYGCATTAERVIKAASDDALLPDAYVINNELKERAFEIGKIYLDIRKDYPKSDHVLPDEAYIKLLRHQVGKAFSAAQLYKGNQPAYTINIAIEEMRFTAGWFLIPKPSIFRVRIEIVRPDKTVVMRGSLRSAEMRTTTVFMGGILTPLAIPHSTSIMAHANLIPAMAVLITKVMMGLQEGKTLNTIEILSDDYPSPPADKILYNNNLGIAPLTYQETEAITGLRLSDYE